MFPRRYSRMSIMGILDYATQLSDIVLYEMPDLNADT
jgi:hypothetical protein